MAVYFKKGKRGPRKPAVKLAPMDYAVYLLSLRLQSEGQIRAKMRQKSYSPAEIDETIKRLADLHYLNDEQFAQIFFENLKKYKLFGYYGIIRKMSEKKIERPVIDRIARGFSVRDELAIARKLAKKNSRKTEVQLMRLLASKGFRGDVIKKLISGARAVEDDADRRDE